MILNDIFETASAGATSAGSIASGPIGGAVGFDGDMSRSIYTQIKKHRKHNKKKQMKESIPLTLDEGPKIKVGQIVKFGSAGYVRTGRVREVFSNIKNGRPGFDAILVKSTNPHDKVGDDVWAYMSQIIESKGLEEESVLGNTKPYYQPKVLRGKDKMKPTGPVLGGNPNRREKPINKKFVGCGRENKGKAISEDISLLAAEQPDLMLARRTLLTQGFKVNAWNRADNLRGYKRYSIFEKIVDGEAITIKLIWHNNYGNHFIWSASGPNNKRLGYSTGISSLFTFLRELSKTNEDYLKPKKCDVCKDEPCTCDKADTKKKDNRLDEFYNDPNSEINADNEEEERLKTEIDYAYHVMDGEEDEVDPATRKEAQQHLKKLLAKAQELGYREKWNKEYKEKEERGDGPDIAAANPPEFGGGIPGALTSRFSPEFYDMIDTVKGKVTHDKSPNPKDQKMLKGMGIQPFDGPEGLLPYSRVPYKPLRAVQPSGNDKSPNFNDKKMLKGMGIEPYVGEPEGLLPYGRKPLRAVRPPDKPGFSEGVMAKKIDGLILESMWTKIDKNWKRRATPEAVYAVATKMAVKLHEKLGYKSADDCVEKIISTFVNHPKGLSLRETPNMKFRKNAIDNVRKRADWYEKLGKEGTTVDLKDNPFAKNPSYTMGPEEKSYMLKRAAEKRKQVRDLEGDWLGQWDN